MLQTGPSERLAISNMADIVSARGIVRQLAGSIGFGLADQARLATAVSELTRNVMQYAGNGFCEITDTSDIKEISIQVLVEDHGPGIGNLDKAMQDGYSTSGGLGAGLPGTRRLMDKFAVESEPGLTRITINLIRQRP
ncbi:anti-sigma regulatory factor [Methylicorpusculum sp.]|uniref:anti-sigma regulatory factor n=1 Tax=Methylicorpusculum sp. TaxID=2713644 RepID=UPI0027208552|nr:anti-sigma regulatory factor [Methylicorpusculum sp.]MDO8844841.1 anti-sigma regulatory factor [Methylicorpusculum sp.]